MIFDVRNHGALGDGSNKDTHAIQKAIDACHRAGGGTVLVPPGTYLTGTLFIKSGVELHLTAGATLLGSPDRADYDNSQNAEHDCGLSDERVGNEHLIYARGARQIAITGRGAIDGNGRAFVNISKPNESGREKSVPGWRPGQMVTLFDCQDVLIRDVLLRDSPYWTVWPHGCDRLTIERITILNERHTPNGDGINPDCCRNVHISDCHIEAGDDCIAIRSDDYRLGSPGRACENVTVTNCTLSTPKCGVRLGYAGDGPIRNCTFSNLVMTNTRTGINILVPRDYRPQEHFVVEHGPAIENVTFSNLVMDTRLAVYMWIGHDAARPGCIRNIQISDVIATTERGCYLGGSPTMPIEQVRLANWRLTVRGEMDDQFAKEVPFPYPVYGRWDTRGVPHAFFCRHLRDASFANVCVDWGQATGSWRSAMRAEHVDGIDISHCTLGAAPGATDAPALDFQDVQRASIRGCRVRPRSSVFLRLGGPATGQNTAVGNDLTGADRSFEPDKPDSRALREWANLL